MIILSDFAGVISCNDTIRYEASQSTIQLIIQAKDNGVPSLASVIPVHLTIRDINNHTPAFTNPSYRYVYILCVQYPAIQYC